LHNWLNPSTLYAALPVLGILIPIVAIIAGSIHDSQREAQRHETIRQLVAANRPIPPELLSDEKTREHAPGALAGKYTRAGLLCVGAGIGIAIAIYLGDPSSTDWAWGIVPIFVGIACLIIARIELRARPT
jgi:hypothetical protein